MNPGDAARLEQPPRRVPPGAISAARFGSLAAILGWALAGGFGAFFWVFTLQSELSSAWKFRGAVAQAAGRVETVETTSYRVNSEHLRIVRFVFEDSAGRDFSGVSFAGVSNAPRSGDAVRIEYPSGDPEAARILGLRSKPFPAAVGYVGFIWVVPLVIALAAWLAGGRRMQLLQDGVAATGVVVARERTAARVNRRPVFRHRIEFQDAAGETWTTVARTHETERLPDGGPLLVLYDSHDPSRAVVGEAFPGGLFVSEDGRVALRSTWAAKLWLLPVLLLMGHAIVGVAVLGVGVP